MLKHAYLIIAHKNLKQLKRLLLMLDDGRNDIYLLIDKNSKSIPSNEGFLNLCKNSRLFVLERQKIFWGGGYH